MAKAALDIRSLARSHTETAINVLAGIMEQTTSPESARVSAAMALLDRGWGKPSQPVEVKSDPLDGMTTDELRAYLGAIRAVHMAGAGEQDRGEAEAAGTLN